MTRKDGRCGSQWVEQGEISPELDGKEERVKTTTVDGSGNGRLVTCTSHSRRHLPVDGTQGFERSAPRGSLPLAEWLVMHCKSIITVGARVNSEAP